MESRAKCHENKWKIKEKWEDNWVKLDSCSVCTKYVENSHITFRSLIVFQLLGMNDGMYGLHRLRMQLRAQKSS